jgi:hypothetical protein
MKVLTANRLRDGEAVWFATDAGWAETIDGAEVARDTAAEERLAEIGKAAYRDNLVIDVDLVDGEIVEGRIVPTRLRERIRAAGPTIHPNLGKQARPAAARLA